MRGGLVALLLACLLAGPSSHVQAKSQDVGGLVRDIRHDLLKSIEKRRVQQDFEKEPQDESSEEVKAKAEHEKLEKEEAEAAEQPTTMSVRDKVAAFTTDPENVNTMKSVGAGLVAGAIGSVVSGAEVGAEGKLDIVAGATTGASAALLTNVASRLKRSKLGTEVKMKDPKHILLAGGIGAGVGASSHALTTASGSESLTDMKSRIASGVLGALAGHFLGGHGKAIQRGDGRLMCRELRTGLGGADFVTAKVLRRRAYITLGAAKRVLENVKSAKHLPEVGPDEEDGVPIDALCSYLDADESGFITRSELTQMLFLGQTIRANAFMARVDREVGEADTGVRGEGKVDRAELVDWIRKASPDDALSLVTQDKDGVQHTVYHVTPQILSTASTPPLMKPLISVKAATEMLRQAREILADKGYDLAFDVGLSTLELFNYLKCPECTPFYPSEGEFLTLENLMPLSRDSLNARRLLRLIDLKDAEEEKKKLFLEQHKDEIMQKAKSRRDEQWEEYKKSRLKGTPREKTALPDLSTPVPIDV